MPYKNLDEVPANVAKHKGAALTLEQANKWASIYDALKDQAAVKNPAATAWTTFEEIFELKEDKWTRRKREQAEAMEYVESVGFIQAIEETGADGLPSKARIVIIQEGMTKTKNRNYPASALKALVESKMLDGLKQYDSHPPGSEKIPGATMAPRTISEYLSYIIPGSVQWCENIQLKNGATVKGVVALAKLVDKTFKEKLAEAAETIGVSLNCLWDAFMDGDVQTARRPRKAISADWVTDPNAGGLVLELVEASDLASITTGKEEQTMPVLEKWEDLTPDMIKANCPHIMSWIESDMKDTQRKAEEIVAQAKKDAETAKATTESAQAEAKAATEKLNATEKEFAEFKTASTAATLKVKAIEMVESQATKLNALGKAEVMKAVMAKTFTTETEMAESVAAEIAKIPGVNTPAGKPTDEKAGDKKITMAAKSVEFAERCGYTPEQIERLNRVR